MDRKPLRIRADEARGARPWRRHMARWLVALLGAFVVGCTTVPNRPTAPIPVPYGLTENQVQIAILSAMDQPSPKLSQGAEITDRALSVALPGYGDRRNWYFEDRRPGIIYAGYQRRNWYMRVAVRYDTRVVTLFIEESRNLKQSGNKIHKTAIAELHTLEDRLRRSLGQMAQQQPEDSQGGR